MFSNLSDLCAQGLKHVFYRSFGGGGALPYRKDRDANWKC